MGCLDFSLVLHLFLLLLDLKVKQTLSLIFSVVLIYSLSNSGCSSMNYKSVTCKSDVR